MTLPVNAQGGAVPNFNLEATRVFFDLPAAQIAKAQEL
jgi:hypothetical protein